LILYTRYLGRKTHQQVSSKTLPPINPKKKLFTEKSLTRYSQLENLIIPLPELIGINQDTIFTQMQQSMGGIVELLQLRVEN
jgi:hypothetical protein